MGKLRRPRGSRPAGEPNPRPDAEVATLSDMHAERPAVETAAPPAAGAAEESAPVIEAAGIDETSPDLSQAPSSEPSLAAAAPAPEEASEEAPVVEEAPVAEEALVAEEASAPEEASVPEEVLVAEDALVVAEDGAATNVVSLPALIEAPVAAATLDMGRATAQHRFLFAPDRLDIVEISSTIARYVRGESEAAFAHLRALSGARTPADLIRLQVEEVQRAADASLSCWVTVIGKASRVVAFR